MDSPTVSILLATFNGEQYLPELLASLTAQSHASWRLHIRDDGSQDATSKIIAAAAARDARISTVIDGRGNLGPLGNFGQLLEVIEADYYMFADQDDVWLPDKIEVSLAMLRRRESELGLQHPLLVFTDLRVTDQALRTLHASELRRHGFDRAIARGLGLSTLVTQNFGAGCTMLFNRAMRDAAVPIPRDSVMHDWWLMLCAAAVGTILYLDRQTILYRQHDHNQMGAAGPLRRIVKVLNGGGSAYLERQQQARIQAGELLRRFEPELHNRNDLPAVRLFAQLGRWPPPLRQFKALRAGLGKYGWLRNLAFYALM
jgi:rhamnosyltransferase